MLVDTAVLEAELNEISSSRGRLASQLSIDLKNLEGLLDRHLKKKQPDLSAAALAFLNIDFLNRTLLENAALPGTSGFAVSVVEGFLSHYAAGKGKADTRRLKCDTPIMLSAFFRALKVIDFTPSDKQLTTIVSTVSFVANYIKSNALAMHLDGGSERNRVTSVYLSWCCAKALSLASEFFESKSSPEDSAGLNQVARDVTAAVTVLSTWSERSLALLIANHHAGLATRFDSVELAFSVATATLLNPSPENIKLAHHALELLFANYLADGCLTAARQPIFADNFRSGFASTTEALTAILESDEQAIREDCRVLPSRWRHLMSAWSWLDRNKRPEDDIYVLDRDGFATEETGLLIQSTAIAFEGTIQYLLEARANTLARSILGVRGFTVDRDFVDISYPLNCHDFISKLVVERILTRTRRPQAMYSLIFYGPPGSSKTTLAKKIAQDLRWPFLEITQRDFLLRGRDFIDASADRIFKLISNLKDVVVLFDELEELILDREHQDDKESRLLTTSMLPRIHELRDRKKIVFVFATNRQRSLDAAATRLGRFDIVKCILPPDEATRRAFFSKQVMKRLASNKKMEPVAVWASSRMFGPATKYLSIGELKFLLDMLDHQSESGELSLVQIDELVEGLRAQVSISGIDFYLEQSKRVDRPQSDMARLAKRL